MSEPLKPCLDCGELSERNRCQEHRRAASRAKEERYIEQHGHRRERLAGHGTSEWIKLSKRARRLQEFCMDCRRTADELRAVGERLEADHLPIAHFKQANRKPLSLNDIEVVCGPCNIKRGSSRPGTERYEEWETGHESESRAIQSGTRVATAGDMQNAFGGSNQ